MLSRLPGKARRMLFESQGRNQEIVTLAKSEYLEVMPHEVAFHWGLHWLLR